MSRARRSDPVKVVIINTEYVETDAMSFKSVVQRLTGKDSPSPAYSPKHNFSQRTSGGGGGVGGGGGRDVNSKISKKGMSFRDLDNFLLELPNMDDMYQFCAD